MFNVYIVYIVYIPLLRFQAMEHMGPMTHPTLLANHMRLCFDAARSGQWHLLPPHMIVPAATPRL